MSGSTRTKNVLRYKHLHQKQYYLEKLNPTSNSRPQTKCTLFPDIAVCQRKVSRNVAVASEVKTVVNFNCPEEFGYYPHPSDCTQYYVCVFGGALLESCTGGLMYSHELQTCDWPRNVGCDGAEIQGPVSVSATSASPPSRTREEPRTRYTPPTPPPPQPAAIVTSRGQPRQLHHNQQEIIKVCSHPYKISSISVVFVATPTALYGCGRNASTRRRD